MYDFVLLLHSYVRWLVVIAALAAVVKAFTGWSGKRAWGKLDDRLGFAFTLALDIQVLIGIVLYLISPDVHKAFADLAAALADPELRFFALIHWVLVLAAVALAHIGRARARKAEGERRKFRTAALFYSLSILILAVAIPWPFDFGRPLLRL